MKTESSAGIASTFKLWFENFLPKTNQCSFVWRHREKTFNSWSVVQMKSNTRLPVSVKLPFQRYPFETGTMRYFFPLRFIFQTAFYLNGEGGYIVTLSIISNSVLNFLSWPENTKNSCTWSNTRATLKNPWHVLLYHSNSALLSLNAV